MDVLESESVFSFIYRCSCSLFVVVVVWSVREGFGSSFYYQWIDAWLGIYTVIYLFVNSFICELIYFCLSERLNVSYSFFH